MPAFPHHHTPSSPRGFSLMELLVAMGVLSLIVLVMAALFQQTSVAWKGGDSKAKRYSLLRGALGIIERDLTSAVDARTLFTDLALVRAQKFSASSMTFYILGAPSRVKGNDTLRTIFRVEYTLGSSVNRTISSWDGSTFGDPTSVNLLEGNFDTASAEGISITCRYLSVTGSESLPSYQLPAVVNLTVSINNDVFKSYDVGAFSLGPDGEPDTEDDIFTGPKEN